MLERVVLELALGTGLRVSEIAALTCDDLTLGSESGSIVVQRGKGGKRRIVIIAGTLCRLLEQFLGWKKRAGEPTDSEAPLLRSPLREGPLSTRALQKMFERLLGAAGVRHYRFHDLRHTYGSFLLKASENDLVFVRDQMGHGDLSTTAVYLHALNAEKAVNALYA